MGKELEVSASEFRIYMKGLGNRVSSQQDRVVVSRHGRRLFAVVSEEDFEFLQKHRPNPQRASVADPVEVADDFVPANLEHPDNMATEEIQRVYQATVGRADSQTFWWRGKAFTVLKLRTGQYPDTLPLGGLREEVKAARAAAQGGSG